MKRQKDNSNRDSELDATKDATRDNNDDAAASHHQKQSSLFDWSKMSAASYRSPPGIRRGRPSNFLGKTGQGQGRRGSRPRKQVGVKYMVYSGELNNRN